MDFEAQTLRRSMSTPGVQYYSMEDDLFDLGLYQHDDIYPTKMDRSHTTTNLCYMDSANDLLATPQSVQFARPRKTASLSTPHHHSFSHSQNHSNGESGLLTPASINSTPGYHNLQQQQQQQQFNMPCTPHPQVKLDFTTPKSVAMSHSMSDLGPQTQSPTGVNPFYSPPSYLSSTPMSATHSLVTPRATHNNSPAEDLSPNSCSQNASSFPSSISSSTSSFTLPYTLPPSPVMTSALLDGHPHHHHHTQHVPPQDYITAGGSSSTGSPKSQARLAADFALRAAISSANPPPLLVSSSSLSMAARRPGRPPKSLDHKPHKCKLCAKSFRRLEHLKRHAKVHTEERPFQCDVHGCERKFSRSDNLRAHRKTHMKKGGRNVFIEGLDG